LVEYKWCLYTSQSFSSTAHFYKWKKPYLIT
jgi:hypothetical protein